MRKRVIAMLMSLAFQSVEASGKLTGKTANLTWCHVTGLQMLPADVGGVRAICAVVAREIGEAPNPTKVDLKIVSPYLMTAAVVTSDGKWLPLIKLGSSDRPLGARSIRLLAASIAAQNFQYHQEGLPR